MNQTTNRIVEGDIFIVPLTPFFRESFFTEEQYQFWKNGELRRLQAFGINDVDTFNIQVWATNSACDNFTCHQKDYYSMLEGISKEEVKTLFPEEELYKIISFPLTLPYRLLKDLKEGDTLTLHHENGTVFKLTARQLTYRYESFGKFEDALKGRMSKALVEFTKKYS